MATKEELSEQLNSILELEGGVDFSKMTKDDLEMVIKAVSDPSNLIHIGVKNLRSKVKKDLLQRPLEDLLDNPVVEQFIMGEKTGGFLGFGVLNRISPALNSLSKERKDKD